MEARAVADAETARLMAAVAKKYPKSVVLLPGNRVQVTTRGSPRTFDIQGDVWCMRVTYLMRRRHWKLESLQWTSNTGGNVLFKHSKTGETRKFTAPYLAQAVLKAAMEL